MSCVLKGLSSFGTLLRGSIPPRLAVGDCSVATGEVERFWPQLETTVLELGAPGLISRADDMVTVGLRVVFVCCCPRQVVRSLEISGLPIYPNY